MAIAILITPASMTPEQYDGLVKRMEVKELIPPPGCIFHTCLVEESNLSVFELWESEEAMNAFAQKSQQIIEEMGIQPGTMKVFRVHDYYK